MNVMIYHPELGEQKPDAQIEAKISYYYKNHYILYTHLNLSGQGIRYDGNLNADPNEKHIYIVTEKAYRKLANTYTISMECLLD